MSNNDMQGNDYASVAKFRLEGVHDWQTEQGQTDATLICAALDVQAQATLALAYEQRTANLIAALDQVSPQDYAWLKEARDNPESDKGKQLARWDAIGHQIEERLDLK